MYLTNSKDILLAISMIVITIHVVYSYFIIINSIFRKSTIPSWSKIGPLNRFYNFFHTKPLNLLILFVEITIVSFYITISIYPNITDPGNTDISIRIKCISDDLSKTSSELSAVQEELEARIKFVENLKAEAEVAENVISLTDEQVNAVQTKLSQELNATSSKSLFQTILVSLFFFLLGLVVQPIIRVITNKFTKTTNDDDTAAVQTAKYSDEELEQAVKLLDAIKH